MAATAEKVLKGGVRGRLFSYVFSAKRPQAWLRATQTG